MTLVSESCRRAEREVRGSLTSCWLHSVVDQLGLDEVKEICVNRNLGRRRAAGLNEGKAKFQTANRYYNDPAIRVRTSMSTEGEIHFL